MFTAIIYTCLIGTVVCNSTNAVVTTELPQTFSHRSGGLAGMPCIAAGRARATAMADFTKYKYTVECVWSDKK